MSNRDARPLSEKALSALVDACLEEIRQGHVRWGLPLLIALHLGFRRRTLAHFTPDWISVENGKQVVHIPQGLECNIKDDGCYQCNSEETRGPNGTLKPKTGQGEQRTIPLFESWYDFHLEEKRDTHLSEWLDHWFKTRDAGWGYEGPQFPKVLRKVAMRRHDVIADNHQGEEKLNLNRRASTKTTVPDIIPHDLRSTWATQCLKSPKSKPKTVQDWGGWENPDMVDHYRGFIGDPDGTARDGYENGPSAREDDANGTSTDVDMADVYEVYTKITNNESLDGKQYSSDVLEAAYEMIQAS